MKTVRIALGMTLIVMSAFWGCRENGRPAGSIQTQNFGELQDGRSVELFTLVNQNGMEAQITNYGGIVVTLSVSNKEGVFEDVVLGYDFLDGYVKNNPYFGAIVGQYGNRIDQGKFTLDGETIQLTINDGKNHLHGGIKGWNQALFDAKAKVTREGPSLMLSKTFPDGDQGYPGPVHIRVDYTLTAENGLKIDYMATTEKPTIINPTHHSYFNLSGDPSTTILKHQVMINADAFTPVNGELIPTGELRPVEGTPFDFRKPTAIGDRIGDDNEQLKFAGGYDQNFILKDYDKTVRLAARVMDPKSGRVLEVYTDQPGLQFYSGNFLDGTIQGKNGVVYQKHSAFCLEPQCYPDTPNKPDFPSAVLRPGETYTQSTEYRFLTVQSEL